MEEQNEKKKLEGSEEEDESQKNETEFCLTNPIYSVPLLGLYTPDTWAFAR
jgi:hypothetical protein